MRGVFAGDKSSKAESDNLERMLQEISADELKAAVSAAVRDGAAVMFAATRDKGALVVTLMHGSERGKVYITSTPEFEEALRDLRASCGEQAPIATRKPR